MGYFPIFITIPFTFEDEKGAKVQISYIVVTNNHFSKRYTFRESSTNANTGIFFNFF